MYYVIHIGTLLEPQIHRRQLNHRQAVRRRIFENHFLGSHLYDKTYIYTFVQYFKEYPIKNAPTCPRQIPRCSSQGALLFTGDLGPN